MSNEFIAEVPAQAYALLNSLAAVIGLELADLDLANDSDSSVREVAYRSEDGEKVWRKLGTNPVATDPDGAGPKTAIESAYNVDKNGNGVADLEDAARAAAKEYGLTPAETERLIEWLKQHETQFIAGSKIENYRDVESGIHDVLIQKGEAVMGNGDFTAERGRFDLPEPEKGVQGTFVRDDGSKIDLTIADKCANPIITDHVPESEPEPEAPAVVDACPEDGTLFDNLEPGVYEANQTIQVQDHRGNMKDYPVHVVIGTDPADAQRLGWADNRHGKVFTQMFYRDADGCLHNVGCYYPGWADSQSGSLRPIRTPGETSVWDPAIDDRDHDGYQDRGEGRIPPRGEGKDAVVGAGMLEAEFRRSGITAFTRIRETLTN